jgi:hypothetical protein
MGDILLRDGETAGHIGKTCIGTSLFQGTQTVCRGNQLMEIPYTGSCADVGEGFHCCQDGPAGSYGGAVCVTSPCNAKTTTATSVELSVSNAEWLPYSVLDGKNCMSTYMMENNIIKCEDGSQWTDKQINGVLMVKMQVGALKDAQNVGISVIPSTSSSIELTPRATSNGFLTCPTFGNGWGNAGSYCIRGDLYYCNSAGSSPSYKIETCTRGCLPNPPTVPDKCIASFGSFPKYPSYPTTFPRYPAYPPPVWNRPPPFGGRPQEDCRDAIDPCFSPTSYCCRVQQQSYY